MAEITLKINGRSYDMACDDGEEKRIMQLAEYVDSRLGMIAKSGAARNESHLLVLTSLVLADEIFDLREGKSPASGGLDPADEARIKTMVEAMTSRVKELSDKVSQTAA